MNDIAYLKIQVAILSKKVNNLEQSLLLSNSRVSFGIEALDPNSPTGDELENINKVLERRSNIPEFVEWDDVY